LEQKDDTLIEEMYRFWKHPLANRSIEDRISVQGMVRTLQQHQAYAAYWHLKTERLGWKEYPAYGASINADKPGFGKVSGNSRMRVSDESEY
jgi:hypothetical protein